MVAACWINTVTIKYILRIKIHLKSSKVFTEILFVTSVCKYTLCSDTCFCFHGVEVMVRHSKGVSPDLQN